MAKNANPEEAMWEILSGLLISTALSGVLPLVNAELLVVGAASVVPLGGVPLVVAIATIGQMATKSLLFGLARAAPDRLPQRARARLSAASRAVEKRGGAAGSLVFASAAIGLPPFYGVSLASGALGMRWRPFVLTGAAGRFCRFAVLAWGSHAVTSETLPRLTAYLTSLPFIGG